MLEASNTFFLNIDFSYPFSSREQKQNSGYDEKQPIFNCLNNKGRFISALFMKIIKLKYKFSSFVWFFTAYFWYDSYN